MWAIPWSTFVECTSSGVHSTAASRDAARRAWRFFIQQRYFTVSYFLLPNFCRPRTEEAHPRPRASSLVCARLSPFAEAARARALRACAVDAGRAAERDAETCHR